MSERYSQSDILAQRLDVALPPDKLAVPAASPDPLVNTAAALAQILVPALPAGLSNRIEARILGAFDAQYRVRGRFRRRSETVIRWALVASLALVLLLVGVTPAVAASLPGEPLYSVKQVYEKFELAAATTPSSKANVYLQHADRRTLEALTLLDRGQFKPLLVNQAFSNISAAARLDIDVWQSASLHGQLQQIEVALGFVLQNAEQTGLASHAELEPLAQQLELLESHEPPQSLPPARVEPTGVPSGTDTPTEQLTGTAQPTGIRREADGAPTCSPQGRACESQGVPGGEIIPPTHRPTNTPQPTHTPRPTNTHRSDPPTSLAAPGGGNPGNSSENGNPNDEGNAAGGSSNGNGNSNANENGGGNSNAGGNGNGGGKP